MIQITAFVCVAQLRLQDCESARGLLESPTILKCLIADDVVHARELLRSILEDLGFDILEAADAGEALRLAILHLPDVVVIDLNMPNRSGFDLAALLRLQTAFRETPMIALMAAAGDLPAAALHEAGFSAFLPKPIRPAALRSVVSQLAPCNAITGRTS